MAAAWLVSLMAGASAQNPADRYSVGIGLIGSKANNCPVLVATVGPKSPAGLAGIRAGERLVAVNGSPVSALTLRQVSHLLTGTGPGRVSLRMWRDGLFYEVQVPREKNSTILAKHGQKMLPNGLIVPLEATEAEIQHVIRLGSQPPQRFVAHLFPEHVPLDANVYHGGFAVIIFKEPAQVIVTGAEGPAAQAGLWQGDIILSVNGAGIAGKSAAEIESLFVRPRPERMTLRVERAGATRTIPFTLQKVSEILAKQGRRLVNGAIVPQDAAQEDLTCFGAAAR
jgi:S1-C subfamily serine protease